MGGGEVDGSGEYPNNLHQIIKFLYFPVDLNILTVKSRHDFNQNIA